MAAASSVYPSGRLRIHAATSFGQHLLTPLLSLYSENFSSVEIDLEVGQRLPDIIDEGYDVAIAVTAELSDSSLISVRLGSVRPIVCASPEYLARFGVPSSASNLRAHLPAFFLVASFFGALGVRRSGTGELRAMWSAQVYGEPS
jgi:DNA-binding transcriptional LysR family regulator